VGTKIPSGFGGELYLDQGQITLRCLLIQVVRGNTTRFSFELSWFEKDGFDELVATEWAASHIGKTPMQTWQNKIRHLRRFLRGWAKNLSGKYKKEKERLLNLIDFLDIQAETCPLTEEGEA
jgi:hypothetical protein